MQSTADAFEALRAAHGKRLPYQTARWPGEGGVCTQVLHVSGESGDKRHYP